MASEVSHSIPSLAAQKKSRIIISLLGLCSLIGLGLNVFLTEHFYQIRNGTAGFRSFCNVSPSSNCDVVAASPYAEFFWGLPLSSFGAGWFLALLATSIFAWNRYWRRDAVRFGLLIAAVGTLFSFAYLWIMMGMLKTYCLLCLGVDATVLGALVLIISLKPEGFREHPLNFSRTKWMFAVSVAALLLSVGILKTRDENRISSSEAQALATQVLETPPVRISSPTNVPSIGPKEAKITIIEFSDFQCPFCRIGALVLNSVLNRYPNQIRVEFRNFPLDQKCHPEMTFTPHPVACESAAAALCANQVGEFEKLYQRLFEEQASLRPGKAIDFAKDLKLDMPRFEACVASQETATSIAMDIREGGLLNVQSTPTFFINGHKMDGPMPLPVWFAIIDKLLQP
ncbi:MAG: thioredoxin domain-containing protein [Bdellovibrio sp.]|nr:thioredoxin domain-containing protein [Bdellovibrio sp.]